MKLLSRIISGILGTLGIACVVCSLFYDGLAKLLLKANVDITVLSGSALYYIGAGLFGVAGIVSMLRKRPLSLVIGAVMLVAAIAAIVVELVLKPV